MAEDAPTTPDARALVGLLAEDSRRRVFAALVLGATSVGEVRDVTGLGAREVVVAVERLGRGGLVEQGAGGTLALLAAAFRRAAAAEAPPPAAADHPDASPEEAAVLRRYLRDGRLVSIPAAGAKRAVVLDVIAQDLEPGLRYTEREVDAVLRGWHPDTAALRRYLVDGGFLDRRPGRRGEYWRAGGTVGGGGGGKAGGKDRRRTGGRAMRDR